MEERVSQEERARKSADAINGSTMHPRSSQPRVELHSQDAKVRAQFDSEERVRVRSTVWVSSAAQLASKLSQGPRPLCLPARSITRDLSRGPICKLAEARSVAGTKSARGATPAQPRKDQPDSVRHRHPEDGQCRDQPRPNIHHTKFPRDHLESFRDVVGAEPCERALVCGKSPGRTFVRKSEHRSQSIFRDAWPIHAECAGFRRGVPVGVRAHVVEYVSRTSNVSEDFRGSIARRSWSRLGQRVNRVGGLDGRAVGSQIIDHDRTDISRSGVIGGRRLTLAHRRSQRRE
jgi:hypothetical protein